MNKVYGLRQHHVTNARKALKTLKHDTVMKHLKTIYEGRKRILHDGD